MPEFPGIDSVIFTHTVVPNLERLGLITDRTGEGWQEIGMLVEQRGLGTAGSLPIVGPGA